MKNIFIISTAVLLISTSAWGQFRSEKNKEKVEALRIAYITDELELSSSEAQLFWPIFNEYEQKQEELRKNRNELLDQATGDATEVLSIYVDNRSQQHEYMLDYIDRLKNVISDEKIVKLLTLDNKFKERLLKRLNTQRARRG